jgi:hypothetical protein
VVGMLAALRHTGVSVQGFVTPSAILLGGCRISPRRSIHALQMEESSPVGSAADIDGLVLSGSMDGFDAVVTSTTDTPIPAATAEALSSLASTVDNAIADLDTVALVVGQENYGLAIVLLGEALWSFFKAPSVDHGVKTLLPAIAAAVVLGVVSGPMVTSGDAGSVATGLGIGTGVSVLMGAVYVARLTAPYSPSPKEIPALGLLVALAGFFSFSQNLVVDGFVTLPSLPSVPSLPTINLPF